MQNINPIFILQPLIVIIFSSALMLYWYKKRRFHGMIWLYTLIAYGAAIALKYVVQIPTIGFVNGLDNPYILGIYYGLQTVFFEVGLAYAIAYLVAKRGSLERKDAEAYGSGLAFWENAVLLSALSLVNLITYYFILSSSSSLATTVYDQLTTAAPGLFSSNIDALGAVTIGSIERFSSMMLHVAWGYLCVMAVLHHNKKLFLIALPMGLVDFLVPFVGDIGVVPFEVLIFFLATIAVFVAWYSTKPYTVQSIGGSATVPPVNEGTAAATSTTDN